MLYSIESDGHPAQGTGQPRPQRVAWAARHPRGQALARGVGQDLVAVDIREHLDL
jgi:hypothetical protein